MWRQRGRDKLSSLRLKHSQLEEDIKRKQVSKPVYQEQTSNNLSELIQKVNGLEQQIAQLKQTSIVSVISSDNNVVSHNNKIKEEIPVFIPSPNLEDKKLSNTSKIEIRKKSVDLDSTLNQLQAVKNESYK